MEEGSCGDEIPCQAGEVAVFVVGGVDGAGDAELGGELGFPYGDGLERGLKVAIFAHGR